MEDMEDLIKQRQLWHLCSSLVVCDVTLLYVTLHYYMSRYITICHVTLLYVTLNYYMSR